MIRSLFVALVAVLLSSTAAVANDGKITCGAVHNLRNFGSEILDTVINLRNVNPSHSAMIRRLTIRNFFGEVVHQSGPAVGVAHPLNTDVSPAQDITTVPPGASYYLTTTQIWTNNFPPGQSGGGVSMSFDVEFTTDGKPELVMIGGSVRARERIFDPPTGSFRQGAEKTRTGVSCISTK